MTIHGAPILRKHVSVNAGGLSGDGEADPLLGISQHTDAAKQTVAHYNLSSDPPLSLLLGTVTAVMLVYTLLNEDQISPDQINILGYSLEGLHQLLPAGLLAVVGIPSVIAGVKGMKDECYQKKTRPCTEKALGYGSHALTLILAAVIFLNAGSNAYIAIEGKNKLPSDAFNKLPVTQVAYATTVVDSGVWGLKNLFDVTRCARRVCLGDRKAEPQAPRLGVEGLIFLSTASNVVRPVFLILATLGRSSERLTYLLYALYFFGAGTGLLAEYIHRRQPPKTET